jgi:hypothetical protein
VHDLRHTAERQHGDVVPCNAVEHGHDDVQLPDQPRHVDVDTVQRVGALHVADDGDEHTRSAIRGIRRGGLVLDAVVRDVITRSTVRSRRVAAWCTFSA